MSERVKTGFVLVLLGLLTLLAGCAAPPGPVPAPARPSTPTPAPPPTSAPPAAPRSPPAAGARGESSAIAGLLESAQRDVAAGRLASAEASLERAVRIEPRNPRPWQELARVRFAQREYAQAESLAARSNSWAGSDASLRAENWRLIAQAREARGDRAGAQAARDAAERAPR